MDRWPLILSVAGVLIAAVPVIVLHSPSDRGGIGFAMLVVQVITTVVGLSVVGVGYYSYRTQRFRPAIRVSLLLVCLGIVGIVGAQVETTGGPLVPIWAWGLAIAVSWAVAAVATKRFEGAASS